MLCLGLKKHFKDFTRLTLSFDGWHKVSTGRQKIKSGLTLFAFNLSKLILIFKYDIILIPQHTKVAAFPRMAFSIRVINSDHWAISYAWLECMKGGTLNTGATAVDPSAPGWMNGTKLWAMVYDFHFVMMCQQRPTGQQASSHCHWHSFWLKALSIPQ